MIRRLRALLCLSVLAIPLQVAHPLGAHAQLTDVGTVQCTAAGSITTSLGPVPQTVAFSGSLILSCTGLGDDAGTWTLTMSGQMSPGFCAGGQGLANVNGNGPDGSVSAGVEITMSATSMHIAGTFSSNDDGGDAFKATLTATPTSGAPCVNTSTQENLNGEASITDLAPPPDLVPCTAQGLELYSPALVVAPLISVAINGQLTLNCIDPVSDDAGGWSLGYGGGGIGNCGAVDGSVAISGSSPHDGAVSGNATYERVGTMMELVGTLTATHDHSFAVWAVLNPSGNCVTTPWSSSSISGQAAIEE
jgi:hypothetical protein